MRALAIGAALLLSGCMQTMDRVTATDFELTGPGQFKFKTLIAPQYPDNESGEAARMEMLQGWLSNNNLCAAGYEITSRQGVKRTPFVTDMYYHGKCRGAA